MKGKVSDFKQNTPLVQCICNKGMRDRHWEQMSKIVEFSLKPDTVSSIIVPNNTWHNLTDHTFYLILTIIMIFLVSLLVKVFLYNRSLWTFKCCEICCDYFTFFAIYVTTFHVLLACTKLNARDLTSHYDKY